MGIITLTDRISVSVRAKNETERNSQKRATGKNIANALTSGGNANISDALADEIGATTKPTITDENGNEWVSIQDIIAAGKKMKDNGAFDGPEYDDYVHNGYHYLRTNTVTCIGYEQRGQVYVNGKYETHTFVEVNEFSASGGMFSTMSMSQEGGNVGMAFGTMIAVDPNALIHRKQYEQCRDIDHIVVLGDYDMDNSYTPKHGIMAHTSLTPDAYGLQTGVLNRNVVEAMLNGNPTIGHHGGGSLIDWTKPDDEIEEDIRRLHESWDVTEHPGASGSMGGTYILAGPIEYNDADPVG